MSCPVRLEALPTGVFEAVVTPENVRGRSSMNSITPLTFPKSRSALWDSSPAGEKFCLHLCSCRKPRLVLLEKALRLAWRHVRHKSRLHFFFLGSLSVDTDEEGVTVTLDRFDPGRDQPGSSSKVPSALLPGDVPVPCLFSTQALPDPLAQSETELQLCFKVLQQQVSGRQTLDLSQLMKVQGGGVCSQRYDAVSFSLSWSSVCPAVAVDAQPVHPVPIIPTALLRSLTSINRPPRAAGHQRGFLTMDQTRKLLLLLESDPKASNLPLVGLWLSGVTHVCNPQVWAWCLRFLFSSALQDRVFSESRCFLLVLFGSTHRAPQFFQCRGPEPEPGPASPLDYQVLTSSQCVTLYQVGSVEGQTLQCELGSDPRSTQVEVFRKAQSSFSSAAPTVTRLSVGDQDSGVEDEDLSPRPSPSPHAPAHQARRVQPSVPELSLLVDSSFTSTQRRPPAPPPVQNTISSSSAPRSSPPQPFHLHSTPNTNLPQPCSCCSTQKYDCTAIFPSPALQTAAAAPPAHHHAPPPDNFHCITPPLSTTHSAPPSLLSPHSHHHTPPPSFSPALPLSIRHNTPPFPPPSSNYPTSPSTHAPPLSSHHHTSPPFSTQMPASLPLDSHSPTSGHCHTPPPPRCPCSHPPAVPWGGDSPSCPPAAHPASPPCLPRPSCVNQCCDQVGGATTTDTYQLLLHQEQQLRLLQAQVQMLLEAQGKLQSSSRESDTQTVRSTTSVAVGTGASLFWADPVQPLPQQEVETSSPPDPPPLHKDLSAVRSTFETEDGGLTGQEVVSPSGQSSGLQSPVLGESASMYGPADDQQNFYQDLMNQLSNRLQEPDSKQEEEEPRRESMSVVSDHSHSPGKKQLGCRDPVVSATLRQLQRLGVSIDPDLPGSDKRLQQTIESSSTLASINPAAVLSRLQVPEPTASSLFPGGSVDLSLEANAIALRYLSDSQLSRLSLAGHAPWARPASASDSLLSPSDMSVATRRYMKKYGLIEEEEEEELASQPLTEAQSGKLLPQRQLTRDPRPKVKVVPGGAKSNMGDKENCPSRQASLFPPSSRHAEGSVGNILDLSRLRQLPKLF